MGLGVGYPSCCRRFAPSLSAVPVAGNLANWFFACGRLWEGLPTLGAKPAPRLATFADLEDFPGQKISCPNRLSSVFKVPRRVYPVDGLIPIANAGLTRWILGRLAPCLRVSAIRRCCCFWRLPIRVLQFECLDQGKLPCEIIEQVFYSPRGLMGVDNSV